MSSFVQFGLAVSASLPIMAVAIAGIVFAFLRHANHPRSSRLVSLGLLCLILNVLGSAAIQVYAHNHPIGGESAVSFGRQLGIFYIGIYILQVAAIILITVAVFADRNARVTTPNNRLERSRVAS